jgi:nucleotide-binding universal stress UspA family protein
VSTAEAQDSATAALRKGGSKYLVVANEGSSLEVVVDDELAQHLDEYLLKLDTDLLAVVYRDRSIFDELRSPSHTKHLLARTKIPLLVLKNR